MLISPAFAQAGGSPMGGGMDFVIMMVLLFAVMYFLMIRPQMKRAKEQKQLMEALQKGDEVVTAGGLVGKITKVGEAYITLEIVPETEILVQKGSVQLPLPKGTIKATQ